MVDRTARVVVVRRSTIVRAGITLAVLAAFGVGVTIGRAMKSSAPPTTIRTAASTVIPADSWPTVLSCGPASARQVRPTRILIGCARGDISVTSVTWSSWATTGASGSGTLDVDNCRPDCATGRVSSSPAFVVLSKPVGSVFQDVLVTPPDGDATPQSSSRPGSGWGSG